ncbi:hypothetical protein JCM11491_001827 [Sporobolomyces phaffii]
MPTVAPPLEVSPFQFLPVLADAFPGPSRGVDPTSSPRPLSPPQHAAPSRSVLGSLVHSVVESVQGQAGPGPRTIRTLEAHRDSVWIASNAGGLATYRVPRPGDVDGDGHVEDPATFAAQAATSRRTLASPPRTPSRRAHAAAAPSVVPESLRLVGEVVEPVTISKKPIDRLTVLPRLDNKAVIFSDGILTFHSLSPTVTPLSVHQYPSIRGVVTYSLDRDELYPVVPSRRDGGTHQQLLVIKKRSLQWIRISNDAPSHASAGTGGGGGGGTAITTIKDLPLPDGATVAALRNGKVCIADGENYSIVDLDAAEAWPLLPISQAPNTDPFPASPVPPSSPTKATTSSTVNEPEARASGTRSDESADDPRQFPSIACVGTREFLVASHTGATTLGVFVNDLGEPCRGTLEWSANLRDLAIDEPHPHEQERRRPRRHGRADDANDEGGYSIALLWNATIEIHGLSSQELRQVVQLPSTAIGGAMHDFGRSATSWRGMLSVTGGIHLGHDQRTRFVQIPLLGGGGGTTSTVPSTPTKSVPRKRVAVGGADPEDDEGRTLTKTLVVVGKNSLYGLVPLTKLVQADTFIEQGRVTECLDLVRGSGPSSLSGAESSYVYLKLAYLALVETDFESSFDHFLKSRCDPRIVVKLFSMVLSSLGSEGGVEGLIGKEDTVQIVNGVVGLVGNRKTIEDYIVDNLNHNYSPHLQPSVETANPTVQLRTQLVETAKDCLLSYLLKWRVARREGEGDVDRAGIGGRRSNDSRKIDIVVDTTLVSLLATANRPEDIKVLLASRNDCVLSRVEQPLLDAGLYDLVAELALKAGRTGRVLEIWTKLVEGEYPPSNRDATEPSTTRRVFDLVWKSKERDVVEKYGLWLLKHDKALGLKLFTDPKQTLTFDTRQLFDKMRSVDSEAADQYLEGAVLSQEKETDPALHVELVKRYLTRLEELLGESQEAKARLREQETVFAQQQTDASTTRSPPASFLDFLTAQYSASISADDSRFSLLDRVRLKAILFLSTSSKYDVQDAKRQLEEMEMNGFRGLTLERVIVYGKLKLDRQALALLLHNLRDLSSAETYSLQIGDPLLPSDLVKLASKLELPLRRANLNHRKHPTSSKREDEEARRKHELARILVEMCLATASTTSNLSPPSEGSAGDQSAIGQHRVARILETQATSLDTIEVLTKIPDEFPLHPLGHFLSRSLRRSLHVQQEGSILKHLASGQNLGISERLFEMQARIGAVIDSGPGEKGSKVVEKASAGREKRSTKEEGTEASGEKEIRVVPASSTGLSLEDAVELDLR